MATRHNKLLCTLHPNSPPGLFHTEETSLNISHGRLPNALLITLERTVRLPDTPPSSRKSQPAAFLPPSMGSFPLYSVDKYKSKLPRSMRRKGGLFIGMYEREAMWIRFHAHEPFMVRVFVGGVNVVSGRAIGDVGPEKGEGEEEQDFLALPEQSWLDGTVTAKGEVRQFVAVCAGGAYSVEAQVGGKEGIGGLQFEITPVKRGCPEMILVKIEGRDVITLKLREEGLNDESKLEDLKRVVAKVLDLPELWLELDLEMPGNCKSRMRWHMDFRDVYIPEGYVLNVVDRVARAADQAAKAEIKRLEESAAQLAKFIAEVKSRKNPTNNMIPGISGPDCMKEGMRKWDGDGSGSMDRDIEIERRQQQTQQPSLFGGGNSAGVSFGCQNKNTQQQSGGLFGNASASSRQNTVAQQAGGLFGGGASSVPNTVPQQAGGLFGQRTLPSTGSEAQPAPHSSFASFVQKSNSRQNTAQTGASIFGSNATPSSNPFSGVHQIQTQSNAQLPITINLTLPATQSILQPPEPPTPIATANKELHLAPGARIRQTLHKSTLPSSVWDHTATLLFNIQILNSAAFQEILGFAPPEPISAKRYSEIGGVLFDLERDVSGVAGRELVSVGEKDEGRFGKAVEGFWENLRGDDCDDEEEYGDEILDFRVSRVLGTEEEEEE